MAVCVSKPHWTLHSPVLVMCLGCLMLWGRNLNIRAVLYVPHNWQNALQTWNAQSVNGRSSYCFGEDVLKRTNTASGLGYTLCVWKRRPVSLQERHVAWRTRVALWHYTQCSIGVFRELPTSRVASYLTHTQDTLNLLYSYSKYGYNNHR